uniref:Thiol:disulfide interchange protein DsbD n=1 Tax=Anthurium amnicola TaxID=1678845 RepID=A0A1D1XZG8_9ARAE
MPLVLKNFCGLSLKTATILLTISWVGTAVYAIVGGLLSYINRDQLVSRNPDLLLAKENLDLIGCGINSVILLITFYGAYVLICSNNFRSLRKYTYGSLFILLLSFLWATFNIIVYVWFKDDFPYLCKSKDVVNNETGRCKSSIQVPMALFMCVNGILSATFFVVLVNSYAQQLRQKENTMRKETQSMDYPSHAIDLS